MNLITCDTDCVHQLDGYCCLDKAKQPSPARKDGCCHFVPIKNDVSARADSLSADKPERL